MTQILKSRPKQSDAIVWDCGIATHHHQTQRVADNCIAKRAEQAARRPGRTQEELAALLREHRAGGITLAAFALRLGVGKERVRQLLMKAEYLERRNASPNPLHRLPRHLVGELMVAGIETFEAARAAVLDGRSLSKRLDGLKTREVLKQWVASEDVRQR